jgi:hypothetical protein
MSDASKLRDIIDGRIDKYIYLCVGSYLKDNDNNALHDEMYKQLVLDLRDIINDECIRLGLE